MAAPVKTPPLSVLIVDDHYIVRSGLVAALESADGVTVVGEAERGDEVVAVYRQCRPAVVLMDLQLPGKSGVEATRELVQQEPAARVLIFSTFARDDEIQAAFDAGALGYLHKSAKRDELVLALRRVAAGEQHVPAAVLRRLSALRTGPAITPKEREVLALIAAGRANKEIAAVLLVSEDTVKRHVSNILDKLHVNDRAQATMEAIRRGIVTVAD
ncbi:response regulator [Horticoccus sp. 23ND18S-11]|uniref:response regulator n=1 Tax=Horticoccus sp. 23ND18S-11 TaxID=3391832 RepID=UPI0039C8EB26